MYYLGEENSQEKVPEEFKNRLLNGKITRAYIKVLATSTKPEFIIDQSNYLKNLKIEDLRYVPDEGFIGGTVAKRVTGNFNNIDEDFSIQDREIVVYIGVDMSDDAENPQTKYINYGNYLIQRPEDDQVTDNTQFTALDYMIKTNIPYKDRMRYPCKLIDIFYDVVDQCGLKTTVTSFLNDDFIVEDNQFDEGTPCRNVLKAIAQVAFNWIRIDQYNNVVMDFEKKDTIDEELTIDQYYNFTKHDEFGPINTIIIKNSQIEGENVTIKDQESIISGKGKNKFNKDNMTYKDGYYLDKNGKEVADGNWQYTDYIKVDSEDITISKVDGTLPAICGYDENKNFLVGKNYNNQISVTITSTQKIKYVRFSVKKDWFTFKENYYTLEFPLYLDDYPYIGKIQVEENNEATDYEDFTPNGENAIVISDNPFAYTQSKRSQLIQAGRNLFGLRYTPLTLDTIGYIYLNCIDKIKVTNLNGKSFETYLFDHTIDYQGTVSDNISSTALTQTETKYQFQDEVSSALKRTEIIVDKHEQSITNIATEQDDFSKKISQLVIDLDGIDSTVQNIFDFQRNITGNNELLLEDALPTNILRFRAISQNVKGGIYPSKTLFPSKTLYPKRGGTLLTIIVRTYSRYITPEPIYPSKTLFPSKTLYPKPSVYETKEYPIYIGQPMHSAFGKSDELLIEYDEEQNICVAKVIRYIDYNGGDLRLYDEPQEEVVEKLDIELFKGNNYISIKEFTDWDLEASYLFNNKLNEEFATNVETGTQIRQTADEINIEVSKKVDGDKIISSINLSPENIAITSSKIALEGYTTINGNFSVDEYGNMRCIDASLGGSFYQYDSDGNLSIAIRNNNIKIYDFDDNGQFLGAIAAVTVNSTGESGIDLYVQRGNTLYLGYKESEGANEIKSLFSYDTSNLESTPWIINTVNGTLFPDAGGVQVEHGLIKSWDMLGATGTLFSSAGGIQVKNGLITEWNMSTATGEVTVDGITFVIRDGLIIQTYSNHSTNSNKISTMSVDKEKVNNIKSINKKSIKNISKPDLYNKEKIINLNAKRRKYK